MKHVLLFIVSATLLYSCRYFDGERVRGNGQPSTDVRSVRSFDHVASFGSFDIELTTGNEQSVKVETDENLQEFIETYVDGNTLKIKTRDGYSIRPRGHTKIYVTSPNYSSAIANGSGNITGRNQIMSNGKLKLEVNGSGNIEMDVKAETVETHIAGSGNINVSGSAKEGENSIHGSGNIRAGDLQTEESSVEIAGSGDVQVYATSKLDVNIMGSGGVRYKGDASVSSHIAGSGSVSKIN